MKRLYYESMIFKFWPFRHYKAIVLLGFVFFKYPRSAVTKATLRHEMVHLEQIKQHGLIGFYFKYLRDYIRGFLKYWNHRSAYLSIPFEREAFKRGEGIDVSKNL